MQKIDKNEILSKNYKEWVASLGEVHPKYDSSFKKDYYTDIKMSLLFCQKGLCAYSEKSLCKDKYLDKNNWDTKYKIELTKEDKSAIRGDLEHFDESLKPTKAFLWNNLFVVDTHINCRIKGTKAIKNILKPDNPNYDPADYLDFDLETGMFSPLVSLSKEDIEDVKYMISILGLNCYQDDRKEYLELFKELKEFNSKTEPRQYLTAWNMTLKQLEEEKNAKNN